MRSQIARLLGLCILAVCGFATAFAQQTADTIVTRGKILTVDAGFSVVEALAITGGRIIARGTSESIARYAGPATRIVDVVGATVIPGLIDNHFHLTRAVERWHRQARFEGVGSRREALEDPGRQSAEHAGRRVDHGAGWLDAAPVRRRAGRVHARGA